MAPRGGEFARRRFAFCTPNETGAGLLKCEKETGDASTKEGYGHVAVPYMPDSGTEIDGEGMTSTSRCRRDRRAGRLGATHFPARAP
jgi:hypothetical protein